MIREEKLVRMDLAAKQDRERLFKVTDGLRYQPKYSAYLTELETLCEAWRDMTTIEGYPEIKWPLELPDWMPEVKFASSWDADYAVETDDTIIEEE